MTDKIDLLIKIMETHKNSTEWRLDKIDDNLSEHMRRTALLENWAKGAEIKLAHIDKVVSKPHIDINWKKVTGAFSAIVIAIGAIIQAFGS